MQTLIIIATINFNNCKIILYFIYITWISNYFVFFIIHTRIEEQEVQSQQNKNKTKLSVFRVR